MRHGKGVGTSAEAIYEQSWPCKFLCIHKIRVGVNQNRGRSGENLFIYGSLVTVNSLNALDTKVLAKPRSTIYDLARSDRSLDIQGVFNLLL